MLGWIGNVFIVGGLYGVANKRRNAFISSMLGESFWIANATLRHDPALVSICIVFLGMAVYGYFKWGD